MNSESPSELMQTAIDAANIGGAILKERFYAHREISYKGGIDLVTDADKASEVAVLALIQQRYPTHAILAEESGASPGSGINLSANYRWIVDPLDGTTNYAHRVPQFCVSVGVEGPNGILAGAVFDPMRGEMFHAAKGQGAWLTEQFEDGTKRRLQASDASDLGTALLSTGFPYDIRENPRKPIQLFDYFVRHAQGIRRMGAAALDLAYVAAGRFDGFFEFGLKPWDIAAGAILIEEAGGFVANMNGSALQLDGGNIIASAMNLKVAILRGCFESLQQARDGA